MLKIVALKYIDLEIPGNLSVMITGLFDTSRTCCLVRENSLKYPRAGKVAVVMRPVNEITVRLLENNL